MEIPRPNAEAAARDRSMTEGLAMIARNVGVLVSTSKPIAVTKRHGLPATLVQAPALRRSRWMAPPDGGSRDERANPRAAGVPGPPTPETLHAAWIRQDKKGMEEAQIAA